MPIHSVIQAPDGRRMSKSLGTGIDPLDEIAAHGADAVRFGLLAMSSTQDVRFSADRVRQGRDLANKLWNASRLILLGVQEGVEPSPDRAETVEDRWILSRLERVTARTDELIERFELSAAALELYDFFWSELCDWYLELAKPRLYDGDRAPSRPRCCFALDRTLRLLHPMMPHVTEEIWSFMPGERGLLAVAAWPAAGRAARATRRPRRRWAARSRRSPSCAATATQAGVKPSAMLPARLDAEGYDGARAAGGPPGPARASSERRRAVAEVPVPGGTVELLPSRRLRPRRGRPRGSPRERDRAARRDRAAGEEARATTASWSRRRRTSWRASGPSSTSYRRALEQPAT